jgi:APA family basic amino acid/polyamine antiporter
MAFGGTVGVGILRLPSTLAAQLGDAKLIVLFWVLGGLYALLGAMSVAELAAMMPTAGGFYVYARRAFGPGLGFVIGLADWLNEVSALAYAALTGAAFLAELWPQTLIPANLVASVFLLLFTVLHWSGIRLSGVLTRIISLSVGVMFIAVVIGCFLAPAAPTAAPMPVSLGTLGIIGPAVIALRSVFVAYDGWYSPVYMAEESTSPGQTLPRSIIGGAALVAVIYVLFNAAIVHALPISVLAASKLPAADAARLFLPNGGGTVVTVVSLLTVLSLINAIMLMTPRIILALGRDGLLARGTARVSAGGTPRVALAATSACAIGLVLWGSFDEIIAIAAVLFLMLYVSAYAALFVLRRREPSLPRPYRTFGFPATTLIVLAGCLALWVAAIFDDLKAALYAALLVIAWLPLYLWIRWRREAAPAA